MAAANAYRLMLISYRLSRRPVTSALLAAALSLVGCATRRAEAPPGMTVTVLANLQFVWYANPDHRAFDISIAPGTYVRVADEGDQVYYGADAGLVSCVPRGAAAEMVRGGVGFSRKTGRFFAWRLAPSFTSRRLLNGVLDTFDDAPPVRIFLGYLPSAAERHLRLARQL